MPLRFGETFAGYRILRLLGSGGMGEVYLAEHPRLPRKEALKVLRPDISRDPSFRERFIREADLAAGLRHPHIVGIHDRGESQDQLWISMDYVEGTDLGNLMKERYPAGMPVDLVVPIVHAVASALDYAHRKGLLHRDVKPANVMVADLDTDDPSIFLADFGIARSLDDGSGLTATNMTVGTVAYAAPEQLMGAEMDGRADQYALAASTYHLLSGVQLFPHSNPAVVIGRQLNASVPTLAETRPELASLDPAISTSLAKNPDDRFTRCTDFSRAITEAAVPQAMRNVAAPTTSAPVARGLHLRPMRDDTDANGKADSLVRRSVTGVSLAAVLVLLSGVVMLWRPWQHSQSDSSVVSAKTAPTSAMPSAVPSLTPTSTAPVPTTAVMTPSVVRTPTVHSPNDEIPNIQGADWAGYNKAMEQGMSSRGVQTMTGVVWTDSAAWVCDWHRQGASQAAVEDWLTNKYNGLSYDDARVIYRSSMDWVCPVDGPAPAPTTTVTTLASNPNGPGCSSQHLDKCGQWTPEQAAFACKAVMSGSDYTTDLKRMLVNRYGLDESSAFFLGKEAMYSVNSGGAYIPPPSNAEGFHPLCNDLVP